jgi:hypothetical protein
LDAAMDSATISVVVIMSVINSLVSQEARLIDITKLPLVFKDIAEGNFDEVGNAIENRPTMYDDEDSQDEPEEDDDR